MIRRDPLVSGEMYHIYNRGAHKQKIFTNDRDYARFSFLLHLANNSEAVHLSNIFNGKKYQGRSLLDVFDREEIDHALVNIYAYCLMPNHFHLMLEQKIDDGVSIFMKRISTAYAMYFNIKYEHSGVLFQGRFKSKHVEQDAYAQWLFSYIHLNPLELIEPQWKENDVKDKQSARIFLANYKYSSFYDYAIGTRPEKIILVDKEAQTLFGELDSLEGLLQSYSNSNEKENIKDRP